MKIHKRRIKWRTFHRDGFFIYQAIGKNDKGNDVTKTVEFEAYNPVRRRLEKYHC